MLTEPWLSGTCFVDQAGLELIEIFLSLLLDTEIKGMRHHKQAFFFFFKFRSHIYFVYVQVYACLRAQVEVRGHLWESIILGCGF